MMNLKQVLGENFCQYPKLNQVLNPGLTCLLGPNGSGKSNLVRAIYLCLVGEVYGTPNLVRIGHAKGFVSLVAETPQGLLTITRKLKHNEKTNGTSISHELDAAWLDQPLTRKADITAFLAPHIGVAVDALQHVSFALQGKFESLMMIDHMPRARMMNTLMGLERAEKLRGILKDGQALLADMPDRAEQLRFLQAEHAAAVIAEAAAGDAHQAAKAEITDAVTQAHAQALTTQAKPASDKRDTDLQQLNNQLLLCTETVTGHAATEAALKLKLSTVEPPNTEGYNAHLLWQRNKEESDRYQLEFDVAYALPAPVVLSSVVLNQCDEAMHSTLRDMHSKLLELTTIIAGYGTGKCVTCNQDLPCDYDIIDTKAQEHNLRIDYDVKFKEFQDATTLVATYGRDKAAWDSRTLVPERNLTAALNRLAESSGMAEFDVPAYQQTLKAYQQATKTQQEHTAALEALGKARADVATLQIDIAKLESADVATPEQHAWANSMIAAYDSALIKVQDCALVCNTTSKKVVEHATRITALEEDTEKASTNKDARDLLQFARDQLHPEKLPRLASQGKIAAINKAMSKYLDMFAFPYGFRLDENCDFVVDFDSSKGHPAAILSGGEKVRAALSMRFALMDVFSAGCGILIIDEPTTALDEDAVAALVEVLGTAASYFKTRNIKILCPTHAQQLTSVADTLITAGDQ